MQPVKLLLQHARERGQPHAFNLTAINLSSLVSQSIQLARLSVTETRDLAAIRADYELRRQRLEDIHAEVMQMIDREYRSRDLQVNLIHQTTQALIGAGQYEIAQQVLNRLADILAVSPLQDALKYRSQAD